MEDRRRSSRIGVSFPVECRFLPRRDYFYTVSKNLSLHGVKIISDNFLPKGDSSKVSINLVNRIVEMKAKVVWCSKERLSERFSAGLEFVEINDRNKKMLAEFLITVS